MTPYRNPALPVEERLEDLLNRMTLDEKCDQLLQTTIGPDVNPNNLGDGGEFRPSIGSILSYFGGAHKRNEFQRRAVEGTRLGIPIIWGMDVIHGWRTGFPVPLAQACTWNPETVEACCRVAAKECSAEGIDWTFAPMVDIPNDPRWGRVMESFGEDPYASGLFARASVRGYQTADPSAPDAVAACLKHFAGYAASEGGRDYSYSDISARKLHEIYLPSFHAGVDEGALTLMSSFNDVTGTPAVVNRYLMTEILRDRWGFSGFVVSDWDSFRQLKAQGFSGDPEKVAIRCLSAGNDMEMVSECFKLLPELVRSGRLAEAVVDEAVRRVLRVKFKLGLFEHPYTEEQPVEATALLPEYRRLARKAAQQCAVLLKNENSLLPLDPASIRTVALVGPVAEDAAALVGNWRGNVDPATVPTLADVIGEFFPQSRIITVPGCGFETAAEGEIASAVEAARGADVILAALGEEWNRSGENCSRADIALPAVQRNLLHGLAATGKPVVLLVSAGRPILYPELEPCANAILHLWQGGHEAARACFDLLTGECNPSGRLAMTFPRSMGQIPIYYNEHRRARPDQGYYHDLEESPMYPFGYGLSYTSFTYSDLSIKEDLTASVKVTNAGERRGTETVFLYLSDPEAELTQPARRLIAFRQLELAPGESRVVRFELDKMRDLAYTGPAGERIFEEGEFVLSTAGLTISFECR
ncbi:glycoside hydrolase family 3 N-terminal domain-containing protein [uncultured Victivallis sp.]|uniref:glycoside hydrolase family 3 N-terminal domain-containing protein n=1 Tax=uncultured Victivallis sp. TaxID=354118 RepID=UPI0025E5E79D|nr:glycoside hydrolase family 3 N-terminal domain-containing protein [uncultured Victivallis sp.]